MTYTFKMITDENILEQENKAIRNGIINFNAPHIGSKPERFSISVEDDSDEIIGGAIVYAHTSSVYIDVLWVDETHRGNGLGQKILLAVETEALNRHITQSTLDTFSFQAESFYLKQGYKQIGVIKNYIEGYDRIYLRKDLQ